MDTQEVIQQLDSLIDRINSLKAGLIASDEPASGIAEKKVAEGICPWCNKPLSTGQTNPRGLHPHCYKTSRRRIESGRYTDEQFVKSGLILPAGTPGRRISDDDPATRVAEQDAKRLAEIEKSDRSAKPPKQKKPHGK